MRDDHSDNEPQGKSSQPRAGMKRRDLSLSALRCWLPPRCREAAVATSSPTASAQAPAAAPAAAGALDRTVLPLAEPTYPAITELDAANTKAPPIFEVKAPPGAPNVIRRPSIGEGRHRLGGVMTC